MRVTALTDNLSARQCSELVSSYVPSVGTGWNLSSINKLAENFSRRTCAHVESVDLSRVRSTDEADCPIVTRPHAQFTTTL
jgi:hypothetical protein